MKRLKEYEIGSQANCSDCEWRYDGREETTSKAIKHAKKTCHEVFIETVYIKVIPKNYYGFL